MAYGKMVWNPLQTKAIYLDDSHYLTMAEAPNLITTNPGFETGDSTGYTVIFGDLVISDVGAYSGSYGASLTNTSPSGPTLINTGTFNLERGKRYKIGAAVKANIEHFAEFKVVDEYGQIVVHGAFTFPTDAQKMVFINITAPRDAANCTLGIGVYYCGIETITVLIDDLTITPDYLDFGTEDFALDLLVQPLAGSGSQAIAAKYAGTTPNGVGWILTLNRSDNKYYFALNDGAGADVSISSSAVAAVSSPAFHWLRVLVSRTLDTVSFFVNGAAAGSGSIAAITGNLSCSQELRLFADYAGTSTFAGFCDFIRFYRGADLGAAWLAEEWAAIQYGVRRRNLTACWDFENSLLDNSADLLSLLYTPADDPVYVDGWPYAAGQVSYLFLLNYLYGHIDGYLDSDDRERALDGSLYAFAGPDKRVFTLNFENVEAAQMQALMAACRSSEPIDLYLDSSFPDKDAAVRPKQLPQPTSQPYFLNGHYLWSLELELEEV